MRGRMQPLDVAVIGAGGIAGTYAEVLSASPDANVVAVVDVRVDAARAMADKFGCSVFHSHEALLRAASVDAAILCTPPVTHAPIALDLLGQGVAVLCEKPFALDLSSATDMLDAAERADAVLTMGSKFRYVEDIVKALSIVHSGILGDVVLFENAFTSRVNMVGRWNSDASVSGGGVIIDNGPHSVDVSRYFLGPLCEVMAVEGRRSQELAVEDTARLFVRSTAGVVGNIDLSWSIDKSLDHFVWIFGTHGEVRVGWRGSSFRQVTSGEWVPFGCGYDKFDAMSRQVRNFLCAVRGREELLITGEDALASVGVIEAAYASLAESHWVQVADDTASSRRTSSA